MWCGVVCHVVACGVVWYCVVLCCVVLCCVVLCCVVLCCVMLCCVVLCCVVLCCAVLCCVVLCEVYLVLSVYEVKLARRVCAGRFSPPFPIFCPHVGDPREGRGDVAILPHVWAVVDDPSTALEMIVKMKKTFVLCVVTNAPQQSVGSAIRSIVLNVLTQTLVGMKFGTTIPYPFLTSMNFPCYNTPNIIWLEHNPR